MKIIKILQALLLLLLAGFLMNLFFILFDCDRYIRFLEREFSPDGHISNPNGILVRIQMAFFFLSVCLMATITAWRKEWIRHRNELNRIDKCACLAILILFVSWFLNHYWFSQLPVLKILYIEDGFFEYLTAVCALLSFVLLLISINNKEGAIGISIKLILSILFFVFGMEEISWGQRLFGWETPGVLKELNYQNESNIHNLFNPYFYILYPAFNLLMCLLLFGSMKLRIIMTSFSRLEKYLYFIPSHGSTFYGMIYLWLVFQSTVWGGELTEEVVSVFVLAYSLNQLYFARTSSTDLNRGPID